MTNAPNPYSRVGMDHCRCHFAKVDLEITVILLTADILDGFDGVNSPEARIMNISPLPELLNKAFSCLLRVYRI
jgi:hypothetical protein